MRLSIMPFWVKTDIMNREAKFKFRRFILEGGILSGG